MLSTIPNKAKAHWVFYILTSANTQKFKYPRLQVPDEVIEKTLVQMIVDGFKRGGKLIDLGGLFNVEKDEE